MKNTVKTAFCGIASALICAIMALSILPDVTISVPAVAGLVLIVVVAETGYLWAFAVYLVSSLLSFLYANKTSALLFVCFFGFYPILKPIIEKLKNHICQWSVKILVFNTSVLFCYTVQFIVLNIKFKIWVLIIAWIIGNVAFIIYDFAVSKIAGYYYLKLHKKLSHILRNKS